jgi:hypothetical protein
MHSTLNQLGMHVVLIVTGMLAWPFLGATNRFREELSAGLGPEYLVQVATACTGFDTLYGIDYCGRRLARELTRVSSSTADDLSMIGISLGGLVTRDALMRTDKLVWRRLRHFVTLGSPHLGVRHDMPTWLPWLCRWFPTGRQLILEESALTDLVTHRALVPLDRFHSLTTFYNTINDNRVPAYSASIRNTPNGTLEHDMAAKLNDGLQWERVALTFDGGWFDGWFAHSISSCSGFMHSRWSTTILPQILQILAQ